MPANRIESTQIAWSPITGCKGKCPYCEARRVAKRFGGHDPGDGTKTTRNPGPAPAVLRERLTISTKHGVQRAAAFPFGFEPTLHAYRLDKPAPGAAPETVFVCPAADMFGAWVPDGWIEAVFGACARHPQHRYVFLTRNPGRYAELRESGKLLEGPDVWYGSAVTSPADRIEPLAGHGSRAFLSADPLRADVGAAIHETGAGIGWVVVGAEAGARRGAVRPKKGWVADVVGACRELGIPLYMKGSVLPFWDGAPVRELPWGAPP